MNGREDTVRVENKGEGANVSLAAWHSRDSRAQLWNTIDGAQKEGVKKNGLDAFEATQAIHGSISGINIGEPLAKASASYGGRPASRLSFERMSTQSNAPGLLQNAEPRRRSLDFGIHIDDPNRLVLQDAALCKPLPGFSFRPKQSDAQINHTPSPDNPQRIVRMVSSSKPSLKLQANPLQPRELWCSSLELGVDKEDIRDGEDRRSSVGKSMRSESQKKLLDHGMEVITPVAEGCCGKRGDDELEASRASSADAIERKNRVPQTVTLSKELQKTRTKSRLVEVSFPSNSPRVSSARLDGAKKTTLQSPARLSLCKAEAGEAEEEDPFKDIDLQDEFRKGNFKAITVAQWVAFIVVMGCLMCSLSLKALEGRQLWGLELWKWFLLVLVVLCGRLVSGWLIRILVIIFEKNFLLRKKVLYFVYGLRKGVQNCLWLGLALLAWKLMFDPRVERSKANHRTLVLITRLLECFLIAAFIWLGKVLLVKCLASSFHVTTFFDRIQDSLYNQDVLETLLGPPLLDFAFDSTHKAGQQPTVSLARGVAGKKDNLNEPIRIENLQKMSRQNVSAGVMRQLMNLVKHPGISTLVTTFDEDVFMAEESGDIEINSEKQAKAASKWIFKNVAQEGAEKIEKEDLLRFVTPENVTNVLGLFEGAKETGKITKKALKNWVVKVYQERKALAHSLNDTKTAVKELHRMLNVAVVAIIMVVWVLVLGIATTHVLLFVSSQLLLAGFMFSNTLKQVFEAIIFLFVMHPFDVGDRCIIDGTHLIVEEMKILTTIFLKPDNEKVFYPNSVLTTKPISNLFRSPEMKDFLDFSVHISTPTEKIIAFRQKLTGYVERKSEHWHQKFGLLVKELEDMNRMRLSVTLQHTITGRYFGERLSHRSDLLLEVRRIFAELGIEYRLLTQPVQIDYGEATLSRLAIATYPPPMVPYQGRVM